MIKEQNFRKNATSEEFGPNKNVLRRNSKFHQSMPVGPRRTEFKFEDLTRPPSDFIPKKLESSPNSKKSNQKNCTNKFGSNRFQGLKSGNLKGSDPGGRGKG